MNGRFFRPLALAIILGGSAACATASTTQTVTRSTETKTPTAVSGLIAYATVTGERQGDISQDASTPASLGAAANLEHQEEITIVNWRQDLSVPFDPASGMISGAPRLDGFYLTKYVDRSSPLLQQALITGESLHITLKLYRRDSRGLEEQYYEIRLTDAFVVRQEQVAPNLEEIRLTARQIEQTHTVSQTTSMIDFGMNR